jgi:pimeloyl-ACP methyl ester carboxylesterase
MTVNSSFSDVEVVLVHGAWADGSCWNNLILPLKRIGFAVTCAPIPLTSLKDDVTALRRTIERGKGAVILVGHAYAGAVIAGIHDTRVRSLVYVAALAPDEGETVGDVFYRVAPHPEAPILAPDVHDLVWMPDHGFAHAVAHKASPDQLTIMAAVQRPIALQCIQEKTSAPAWRTTPSWYLLAEEDRMILPETQKFMAERMGATIQKHAVDHTPMYTAPDLVVDVISAAARESLSR